MAARVLIIDDDPSIVLAVKDELEFEGFEVDAAVDGLSGIEKASKFQPDVLLLDLRLPGLNGFEVCRRIRSVMPEAWIIILSVRSEEIDRVRGLEIGADDYVIKPFSLRELVARVRAALRRKSQSAPAPMRRFGDVEIDSRSRRVLKRGKEVSLTRKEFDMLVLLIERAGEVITRDEFLDRLWGQDVYITPRTIDTHIASLRKKIEDDPFNPHYIVGVRGVGYKVDRDSEP
ncbi:MAG TPA: response regulator transcription factor [Pyrinomonadaceae bacterium]|nr:response regulator transcription factor [Pyrinomonadaceae bacterium]